MTQPVTAKARLVLPVGERDHIRGPESAPVTLLEYGDTAPPRLLDWTGECGLCEGTGFEPFERDGYAFVRFCPRGCKPHNDNLDGERPRNRRARSDPPFPDAKGILERLEAICREKTEQGLEGFKYFGMEEQVDAHKSADRRNAPRDHGRASKGGHHSEILSPDGQGLP